MKETNMDMETLTWVKCLVYLKVLPHLLHNFYNVVIAVIMTMKVNKP